MKKINSKIANKLGEKFKETSNSVVLEEKIEEYEPLLNYDEFELDSIKKEQMIKFEEKVIYHTKELSKNTIELSKLFYQAQQTLSFAGSGTFIKWYEGLGFKKDFVYMLLKRNELYIQLANERVFQIPEKAIKAISKLKDKVEPAEILEIVNSNKPVEVAKEKEIHLSGNPNDKKYIEDKNCEIEELKKQIYIKEQELKELKKNLKEKEYLIKKIKK